MMILVTTNPVQIHRALADPTRWRIVRLVLDEPLCVCELADILGMPQSSVSSHVQIIRKAGLLESEKCEKWTYFRIGPEFLRLVRSQGKFFEEVGLPEDFPGAADFLRMEGRLAEREGSCCPGPRKLKSRRKTGTNRQTS